MDSYTIIKGDKDQFCRLVKAEDWRIKAELRKEQVFKDWNNEWEGRKSIWIERRNNVNDKRVNQENVTEWCWMNEAVNANMVGWEFSLSHYKLEIFSKNK